MSRFSDIQKILFEVKKELGKWLKTNFLKIDENFWNTLVLPNLSYQQNIMVNQNGTTTLDGLDLSCLLRVFEKNWFNLTYKITLPQQLRPYLKEMQVIRNRYAHLSEEFQAEDEARDADTIYRFLKCIDADKNIIEKIKQIKQELFVVEDGKETAKKQAVPLKEETFSNDTKADSFKIGDIVRLKSSPEQKGAVIGLSGKEISVFIDGKSLSLYEDQIKKDVPADKNHFTPFLTAKNYLTSFVIKHPSTASLYSLYAARIDLIPYQFRPVMKIIQADQPRLLIADSVGIGKTIEAGLILRELQIRNNVQSVLIVCPKPLVTEKKWEQEMKRFDEDFEALDSRKLQHCISECDKEGEWPDKYGKVIFPYSICDERTLNALNELDPFPKFDLVIVDEAHHIRNTDSIRYKIVKRFCENAEAVVFLSATPIQLQNNDLFTLLNLLRPDLLPDQKTFSVLHQPNPFINEAIRHLKANNLEQAKKSLLEASATDGGRFFRNRPDFQETMDTLFSGDLSHERMLDLITTVSKFHTFSTIINRTLRKDISTDFCKRKPSTVRAVFSEQAQNFFNHLCALKADILREAHGDINVQFMMTTLERQAASCLYGIAPLIGDIMRSGLENTDLDIEETDPDLNDWGNTVFDYKNRIDALIEEAKALPEEDDKFNKFFQIIAEKQASENKKVIVFSTFRHTLAYLYRRLRDKNIRVGLIHGGIDDQERISIRALFEKTSQEPDALDVLLFSEVGCEGLDYQFCDTMINYDLPWNPMKIEQRIGRIDRFGQKSEAVAIYNMVVDGTIDARIYDRCLDRIRIFEESIGECDSILGNIYSEIKKVCENTSLTDAEREEKIKKISDNNYQKIQALRDLEAKQAEFFYLPPKALEAQEVKSFETYWSSPLAMERLVSSYLRKKGKEDAFSGNGDTKTLILSQAVRSALYKDYSDLPVKKGKIFKDWEKYLKGTDSACSVTFEMSSAQKDKDAQFIMPLHPLVAQAANFYQAEIPLETSVQVMDNSLPAGEYPFMVYSWEYKGDTVSIELKPICENEIIQNSLLSFLEDGADCGEIKADTAAIQRMKDKMYVFWQKQKEIYCQKVKQWVDFKVESLNTSTAARIHVAEGRKIDRIREGEIRRINEEKAQKEKALFESAEKADIISTPILIGVVKVIHE